MKKRDILGSVVFALLLSSCSDFLKEDSGDLLIPQQVDEFQAVLNRDGYPQTFTSDVAFIDLMTDDVEVISGITYRTGYDNINISVGRGAYLWEQDVEHYVYDAGNAYEKRYSNILACNTIIDSREKMQGSADARNYCMAQAYALRAYSYFCLVNWYGLPYRKATAAKDMGVAIWLKSDVTRETIGRSTVQEVYDLINQDLDTAIELFDRTESPTSKFQMTKNAALLLKSRVALFTENWDDVIAYGEKVREKGLALYDISQLKPEDIDSKYSFIKIDNPEVVFNFGGAVDYHKYMIGVLDELAGPFFAPSQTESNHLIRLYEEGDNRIYAFFKQDEKRANNPTGDPNLEMVKYYKLPIKFGPYNRSSFQQAFRTAEILLNMAEAYTQKGDEENRQKAVDCLNELRKNRFTADKYTVLTLADFVADKDLLSFVREERRRELCFDETHRWNDLRRTGMPRIVHKFRADEHSPEETYVLEQNDANYTLSLPYSETTYNKTIEDYSRRVIKAQ